MYVPKFEAANIFALKPDILALDREKANKTREDTQLRWEREAPVLLILTQLGDTRDLRRRPRPGTVMPTNNAGMPDADDESEPTTPRTPVITPPWSANSQWNRPDARDAMEINHQRCWTPSRSRTTNERREQSFTVD